MATLDYRTCSVFLRGLYMCGGVWEGLCMCLHVYRSVFVCVCVYIYMYMHVYKYVC